MIADGAKKGRSARIYSGRASGSGCVVAKALIQRKPVALTAIATAAAAAAVLAELVMRVAVSILTVAQWELNAPVLVSGLVHVLDLDLYLALLLWRTRTVVAKLTLPLPLLGHRLAALLLIVLVLPVLAQVDLGLVVLDSLAQK